MHRDGLQHPVTNGEMHPDYNRGNSDSEPSPSMSIPSPCINVCRMSAVTGLCEGCQRTIDEISRWSRSADTERAAILAVVERRRELLGIRSKEGAES